MSNNYTCTASGRSQVYTSQENSQKRKVGPIRKRNTDVVSAFDALDVDPMFID